MQDLLKPEEEASLKISSRQTKRRHTSWSGALLSGVIQVRLKQKKRDVVQDWLKPNQEASFKIGSSPTKKSHSRLGHDQPKDAIEARLKPSTEASLKSDTSPTRRRHSRLAYPQPRGINQDLLKPNQEASFVIGSIKKFNKVDSFTIGSKTTKRRH
ncbi:Hypothetical protein NTJ_15365 [Nesidiocoris tenuis]|uniref:Uncharacterized protein n=1 Tax=Nesidiocoris tenuis TaxID=355587 RepID=A0ABN7BDY7_9HEMI|nr:Hypothetical protein NTJ_15365 [Nesidiocoris tenuis]